MYHAAIPTFLLDQLPIYDFDIMTVYEVQKLFNVEYEFALKRLQHYLTQHKLYAKLESERKQALKDCKAITKAVKEEGEHSDAEYERAVEVVLNLPIITGQIEKKYYEQFKTFLSYKQLYLLKTAERKFNKKLMELQKKDKKHK